MKKYITYLMKKNKVLLMMLSIMIALISAIEILNSVSTVASNELRDYQGVLFYNVWIMLIMAYIIPLVTHRKLFKTTGCDMLYALPITKSKRVVCDIIFGYILIAIPFFLVCVLITIFAFFPTHIKFALWLFYLLYLLMVTSVYLFNTLLTLKCNTLRDAIIVEGLYLFVFLIIANRIGLFILENSFGYAAYSVVIEKLSVFLAALSPLSVLDFMVFANSNWYGSVVTLIYIVYIVLLLFFIASTIKKKSAEDSEGLTTSKITYPFVLSLIVVLLLLTSTAGNTTLKMMASLYVFLFIAYMGANVVAQRNFKMKAKHIILFLLSIGISYGLRYAYIQSNCLGEALLFREKDVSELTDVMLLSEGHNEISIEVNIENRKNVHKACLKAQEYLLDEYHKANINNQSISSRGLHIYYKGGGLTGALSYGLSERQLDYIMKIFVEYQLL